MGQGSCSGLGADLWVPQQVPRGAEPGSYLQRRTREGPGLRLLCSFFLPQDTGLYYHRYLQEVINVLETDGHFREKLQAANAEDIKVRLGASTLGGHACSEGRIPERIRFPKGEPSSHHKTETGENSLLGVT